MTEDRAGRLAAPYFCPFCGEEDLHPVERPGAWTCRLCLRQFTVHLIGGES